MANVQALIIEDQKTSIEVLVQLLNQLQITSHVLLNEEFYARLAQMPTPDIVFLDLEMPIIDGYDVLQILQKDPRFSQVPIVAYTTHVSHLNTAHKAGFHSFLGKPLDSELFPDQVSRILNGEQVWEVP